jgi:7,8-dihydroneopterin aldolase/epimerase/oxygenase
MDGERRHDDPDEDERADREELAGQRGSREDAGARRAGDELGDGSGDGGDEPEPDELDAEDEEEDDELDEDRDDDPDRGAESVTIEITGLSLYTHHGVSEAEREVGQRLVLDLRLDVGETDATATDALEDTIDYAEVCQLVALVVQQRSHKTLERLCSVVADRLLGDYELEGVWVKATKPEPPIPLSVDEVSVEIWREAEE